MRRVAGFVSLLLLVVLLAACAASPSAPSAGQAAGGGTRNLNIALYSEPDFLDPHLSTSVGFVQIDNAYESLVYMDRDSLKIVPQLATSWDVSPDGTVFTFKLRQNVKFHNGDTMDAEAVKFSFERMIQLKKGYSWMLANVESITVKDPYTVEMKVKPGGPPFLQSLPMIRVVSPRAVRENEKNGDMAQEWLNANSAGTGPYKVVRWDRGQKVTMEKFNDYWGGWVHPNHITHINMLVVPEASTQRLMLEKGDIDMAFRFPPEALADLRRNPNLNVEQYEGVRVLYLKLNYQAPPTSDVRVRQAINYAFDFEAFNRAVGGTYSPPAGPVPLVFLGDWQPKFPYKLDIDKAKALLNQAGYNENNKAKIVVGNQPDADVKKISQMIQANLAKTGAAELDIREVDFNQTLRQQSDWIKTKDPKTALHVFGFFTPARVPDAYAYLWYTHHSSASGSFARNVMHYANPTVDRLLDQAEAQRDLVRRMDLHQQATQAIIDDAADLFVGTQTKVYLYSKKLKGFFSHPTWYPHVRAWYLAKE